MKSFQDLPDGALPANPALFLRVDHILSSLRSSGVRFMCRRCSYDVCFDCGMHDNCLIDRSKDSRLGGTVVSQPDT